MKNIKLLLLLLFFTASSMARAQVIITYAMNEPDFLITNMDISKYSVLDTSFLEMTYKLTSIKDTTNPANLSEDQLVLQIGKKYTKFFSGNMFKIDSMMTFLPPRSFKMPDNQSSFQGYEIIRDVKKGDLVVNNRIPFSSSVYTYTESELAQEWKLENGEKEFLGYMCNKASLTFRGREYTAWYTAKIPVAAGPWKFYGLPGAILYISDSKSEYIFECIGVTQKAEPIVKFSWNYNPISKEKMMKMEESIHKQAGYYVNSSNFRVKIFKNGKLEKVPESWQAPYNPIEK